MNIRDIVKKLTGEINPVLETSEDERRLENLATLIEAMDELMGDIREVYLDNHHRREASAQKAARAAENFLKSQFDDISETLRN